MPDTIPAHATRPFPLLADPAGYRPCDWDLADNADDRAYWITLFRNQFAHLEAEARAEAEDRGADATGPLKAAQSDFFGYLDRVRDEPLAEGPLDILTICLRRERALRAAGIADPYRLLKERETANALKVLPTLLNELDAIPDMQRQTELVRGVFAGNIFDAGATETIKLINAGSIDFADVRGKLKPRPWRFDALDGWLDRLDGPPHRAAVLFVDNAGPDIALGMVPFARELCRRGTRVVLTANTEPSLNDITHDELGALIQEAASFDPLLAEASADGRLRLIASGNDAPLIDLSRVAVELAEAVDELGVDLVVLEGMGRSIESNFDTRFTCDVLRLAMIKDAGVARRIDAEPFDLAMRFAPASA